MSHRALGVVWGASEVCPILQLHVQTSTEALSFNMTSRGHCVE